MSLLESGENYLESIYRLSLEQSEVHAIDIANDLGFSKPSVSIALKKLEKDDYISILNGHIFLTTKGKDIAMSIYERHKILTSILINLGVNSKIAEADACKIEHHLSAESFAAIKKIYLSYKK